MRSCGRMHASAASGRMHELHWQACGVLRPDRQKADVWAPVGAHTTLWVRTAIQGAAAVILSSVEVEALRGVQTARRRQRHSGSIQPLRHSSAPGPPFRGRGHSGGLAEVGLHRQRAVVLKKLGLQASSCRRALATAKGSGLLDSWTDGTRARARARVSAPAGNAPPRRP
eukprot:365308-Chlamydomonas_euryale.AAC.6